MIRIDKKSENKDTIKISELIGNRISDTDKLRDIRTIGCEDHLQRRNKLKGIAQQKLILPTLIHQKDDIAIKKILELVSQKAQEYFIVKSPFKTGQQVYNNKYEFVNINEFPETMDVYITEQIINKKWKVCSNPDCKQWILAEMQNTKKCRKCGEGYFRFQTKKFDVWTLLAKGNKQDIIQKLCSEGYLSQVQSLNKRVDFFGYKDKVFRIFESKNKEISGLSFLDLQTSLVYPIIIKKCGYIVEELQIIFNGEVTEELIEQLREGIGKKFSFAIKFIPIRDYLESNNLFDVKKIIVKKTEEGYEYKTITEEGFRGQITIEILE